EEMILETGPADPCDLSVDDQQLAMIHLADLILSPGPRAMRYLTRFLEWKRVIGNDVDPCIRHAIEHRLCVAIDIGPVSVHRQPDLNTRVGPCGQCRGEAITPVPRGENEHSDM